MALCAAGVPNPGHAAGVIVATIDGIGVHRAAAGDHAPDLQEALALLLRALTKL